MVCFAPDFLEAIFYLSIPEVVGDELEDGDEDLFNFLCTFFMFSFDWLFVVVDRFNSWSSEMLSRLNRFFGVNDEKSMPAVVALSSRIWLFSVVDVSLLFADSF